MGRTHEKTAEEYKAEGNQRYKEGKLEEACRSYDAAIELESSLAVYRSNKSACLFELGSYDECVEETRRALALLTGKGGENTQAETSLKVKLCRRLALALLYQVYSTPAQGVAGVAAEIRDLISKVEAVEGAGKDARLCEVSQLLACLQQKTTDQQDKTTKQQEKTAQEEAAAGEKQAAATDDNDDDDDDDGDGPSEEAEVEGEGEGERSERSIPRHALPRFRPPLCTHAREYYAVGHDVPVSGLRGAYDLHRDEEQGLVHLTFDTSGDLDPLARPKGERDVSLLFGGCGDARHFYATLVDVWQRLDKHCGLGEDVFADDDSDGEEEGVEEEGSPELNLHVTLNDVKPESVARSVLMLLELVSLNRAYDKAAAKHAPDGDDFSIVEAVKKSKVVRMGVAHVARIYCGACITQVDDKLLHDNLKMLSKIKDVSAVLPFVRLRGGNRQWRQLQTVYRSWIRLREEVSVETAHKCYSDANSGQRMLRNAYTTGAVDRSGRVNEAIERQQEFHHILTTDIKAWSDDQVKDARDYWEEGMSVKDMRKELLKKADCANVKDLDLAESYPVAAPDIMQHAQTGLLLLEGEGWRPSRSLGPDMLSWYKEWRPNVTMLAKDWMAEKGMGDAFQLHGFETLLSLSKGAVSSAEEHTKLPALLMAATFFLGAARGLHYLTATDGSALGSLTLELHLGEVHAMFEEQDEQEEAGPASSAVVEGTQRDEGTQKGGAALPTPPLSQPLPPPPPSADPSASTGGGPSTGRRFDRISISNICDYTTLLPSFLTLLPTLKTPGQEAGEGTEGTLNHTILLARGMYRDLDDYVKRTVGVGTMGEGGGAALLGARHCGGELWEGHIHWAHARPTAEQRHKAMKQVEAWLHTLFRTICLPPSRPPNQICTENKPLTLRVLFDVLVHLCDLDYPPHSLSLLLSSLLSRPPSPPDTNLFRLCQTELRALSNIYAPLLPFPLPPLLLTTSPGPTRKYRVTVNAADALMGTGGSTLHPVLGAMLIREGREKKGRKGRDAEEEESQGESGEGSGTESDEEDGDGEWWGQDVEPFLERREGVRLLSVITWDSKESCLTFIMGRDEFEGLVREGGWGVRLWRNDGYSFESPSVALARAKRVEL